VTQGSVEQTTKAIPFVNWAGGKSQLISQMAPWLPRAHECSGYIEPFLGGGAVFLTVRPDEATLGDSNGELVNCYRVVRDNVDALISRLSEHVHSKYYFYWLRRQNPDWMDDVARAARFIHLNKTCFNGVYRVNLRGEFNVPYGNRKARVFDEENLRRVSSLLQNAELVEQSYEVTLQNAKPMDFVYLDPPYHPVSKTASFTKYTRSPFGEEDQQILAAEFDRIARLGCRVMLSNSDTELVRRLYRHYKMHSVKANRYINCNGNGRKAVRELLITNYDPSVPWA